MNKNVSKALISIIILTTILLLNIIFWGTSNSFYTEIQKELLISKKTFVSQNQLEYINHEFTKYLQLRRDNLNIKITEEDKEVIVFNEKEIAHMKDVRVLFRLAYFLILGGFLAIFIRAKSYFKKQSTINIYYDIRRSLILATIVSLFFVVVFITSFDVFWEYFHKIFFTNDLYLLNPKTDFLIQMMPLDFFIAMSTRILLSFFTSHIVILFLTRIGVKYYGKKNRS